MIKDQIERFTIKINGFLPHSSPTPSPTFQRQILELFLFSSLTILFIVLSNSSSSITLNNVSIPLFLDLSNLAIFDFIMYKRVTFLSQYSLSFPSAFDSCTVTPGSSICSCQYLQSPSLCKDRILIGILVLLAVHPPLLRPHFSQLYLCFYIVMVHNPYILICIIFNFLYFYLQLESENGKQQTAHMTMSSFFVCLVVCEAQWCERVFFFSASPVSSLGYLRRLFLGRSNGFFLPQAPYITQN